MSDCWHAVYIVSGTRIARIICSSYARRAFWNVSPCGEHRGWAWNPTLHFALQHAEKADERREKRAVARTTAVASSTSRSVSTVAAGTVLTGVAETSESARMPAFPDLPEVRGTSVVGSDWTRRDDTSFSSETLRVTIQEACLTCLAL